MKHITLVAYSTTEGCEGWLQLDGDFGHFDELHINSDSRQEHQHQFSELVFDSENGSLRVPHTKKFPESLVGDMAEEDELTIIQVHCY